MTSKQAEVMRLYRQGLSTCEIARRLGLTESADSEVDPDDSAIEEVLEDPEKLLDQA